MAARLDMNVKDIFLKFEHVSMLSLLSEFCVLCCFLAFSSC